ncbi:MAG: cytochrome b/b6 domain-containing protein [Elainella sp.]
MATPRPYQPLLLRLLHGINGLLVLGALATGFWVYDTYDGRFGRLALPTLADIQGVHGTIALTFLLFFPLFAIYSFHWGQKRLIQPDSLKQLARISQPIGWISLQRLVNTLILIASVLALISGRLMKEEWLPRGELYHAAYSAHLMAWLTMAVCLLLHILMAARVGGLPLLLSIVDTKTRPSDPLVQAMGRLRRSKGD